MKEMIPHNTIMKKLSSDYNSMEVNNAFKGLLNIFIEELKSKLPLYGSIEKLISDNLRKLEKDRLNKLLAQIQENLLVINKDKLDKDFMNTEEFARLVFYGFQKVRTDHREEKIKYYANVLAKYCTVEYSNDFHKEGIIERVSKYSVEHILVLNEAYKIFNLSEENDGTPKGLFVKTDIKIGEVDEEVIEICISDLKANGDLEIMVGFSYSLYSPNEFKISSYGIKLIKTIKDYINESIHIK
jgi:hypothetical protein